MPAVRIARERQEEERRIQERTRREVEKFNQRATPFLNTVRRESELGKFRSLSSDWLKEQTQMLRQEEAERRGAVQVSAFREKARGFMADAGNFDLGGGVPQNIQGTPSREVSTAVQEQAPTPPFQRGVSAPGQATGTSATGGPVRPQREGGGFGLGDIAGTALEQANQRLFEPTELIGGRIVQAAAKTFPRGISAGTQGIGGSRADIGAGQEEARELPEDVRASYRAALGGEKEQEELRARLEEIGLPARVIGGLLFAPDLLIPGLGFTKVDDFARGINAIRRGGSAIDDVPEARLIVEQLRKAESGVPLAGAADDAARIVEETAELPPAARLTEWMRNAEGEFAEGLKQRKGAISASRKAKSERMATIFADESLSPQQQFDQATKALGGADAEVSLFNRPPMTEADVSELLTTVRDHPLLQARKFDMRNTQSALLTLLDGEQPTAGEWKLLERVFGAEFVRAGMKTPQSQWRVVADVLNLPRTVRTIFDHSWPLRQGIGVAARHPVETFGNLPKGLWSMVSDKSFRAWDEAVRAKSQVIQVTDEAGTRPWTVAELQDESRLFLPKMEEITADVAERTEEFLPTQGDSWVSKVFGPITSPFQRSFLGHGNATRSDIFENTLRGWTNGFAEPIEMREVEALSWLLNVATGRGDLGLFNKSSPFIAGGIFSPRLAVARVQHALSPVMLATGAGVPARSGRAANLAAQQLVSLVGAGASVLTLASLAGAGRVEIDPRSSLWGKLELFRDPDNPGANTLKLDLFGGYQQYARTIAQLQQAKSKSDLGIISGRDRRDIFEQFVKNKFSPNLSIALALYTGESGIGEPVDLTSAQGIGTFAWNQLSPLSFNDIVEAVQGDDPIKVGGVSTIEPSAKAAIGGAVAGTLGTLGASANTYNPRASSQLAAIPEFKGMTVEQVSSMKDLWGEAESERKRIREETGADVPVANMIQALGADKGYEPDVVSAAVALRSQTTRDRMRNPDWLKFVVENIGELSASSERWSDPPNYIVDLVRNAGR
jgi:hypothetical protein